MTIGQRFNAAWFGPVPAARLGALRVIVGLFMVWTLLDRRADVAAVSQNGKFSPVGLVRLGPGALSPSGLEGLQDAALALAVLWTLGVAWRITGPLFAVVIAYWGAYRLSFGVLTHGVHLPTLHVIALAFTPAAAAVSVDARLPVPRWLTWTPGPPEGSGHYAWPLRLLSMITACTYFLAGVAKLGRDHGARWATGDNLLGQVGYTVLVRGLYGGPPSNALVTAAFDWPAAMTVLAVGSLVIELGAPLALLDRWLALGWVVAVLGMHAGIDALMGITFAYQTYGIAFLPLFPVERLVPAAWRR